MFLLSHQGSSFRTSGGLLGLHHSLCPRHELGQERCKHRTFFNCLQPPRMGEMPLWSPAAANPPTVGMGRLSEHGALPSAKHWACVSQPCRCCKGRDPGITPGSCSPLTLTFRSSHTCRDDGKGYNPLRHFLSCSSRAKMNWQVPGATGRCSVSRTFSSR